MKKLMMVTAIAAATAATLAQAQTGRYSVSSTVPLPLTELWLDDGNGGAIDLLSAACVSATNAPHLGFGGFVYDDGNNGTVDRTNMTFSGQVEFDVSCGGFGPFVRVDFSLAEGNYATGAPNPGVTFYDGNILVEVLGSTGWVPYPIIDARSTPLPFVANSVGHLGAPQTTSGVVFPAITTGVANNVPLPGTCEGVAPLDGELNTAVSAITLLGSTAGLCLGGNIILTPYP